MAELKLTSMIQKGGFSILIGNADPTACSFVVFVFVYVLLYPYSQNVIGWLAPASNPHFLINLDR